MTRAVTNALDSNSFGVYTTRPDWSHAGESAWSRISKFQWLNRLATLELFAALGIANRELNTDGIDLRHAQAFDLVKMSSTLQQPRNELKQSFCGARRNDPVLGGCVRVLRICPSCIRQAYHATIFQFRFISRCPLHQDLLLRACPVCHQPIAYRLNSALVQNPYACDRCNHAFYGRDSSRRARVMQHSFTPKEADLFAQWRRYIGITLELNVTPAPEKARDSRGTYLPIHPLRLAANLTSRFKFLREIQFYFGRPPPLAPFDAAHHAALLNDFSSQVITAPTNYPQRYAKRWPHLPADYDWYSRQYGELLKRRLIRQNRFEAAIWRKKRSSGTLVVPKSCSPEVVALTAWRFAWEGLHQPRTRRHRFPMLGLLEWFAFAPDRPAAVPMHVWQILLRRSFKRDLERSYLHWLAIAQWMHAQNIYLINRRIWSPGMLWIDPDNLLGEK